MAQPTENSDTVKVFCGNLSFKTTEQELAKEFEISGNVVSANIISRGTRSLGYGFVEFASMKEAEKAVKVMDKKEIDGRPVNVEIAKPRSEERKPREKPEGKGRAPKAPRNENDAPENNAAAPKPRKRNRKRKGKKISEGGEKAEKKEERAPREKRERKVREQVPRTPSKTVLFVANLPFAFTDETFGQVFTDMDIKFKSAHVVTKRNNRSKGFGFVEFETEKEQLEALEKTNGKEAGGRTLTVKIAMTEAPVDPQKEQEEKKPAPKEEEITTEDKSEKEPKKPKAKKEPKKEAKPKKSPEPVKEKKDKQ